MPKLTTSWLPREACQARAQPKTNLKRPTKRETWALCSFLLVGALLCKKEKPKARAAHFLGPRFCHVLPESHPGARRLQRVPLGLARLEVLLTRAARTTRMGKTTGFGLGPKRNQSNRRNFGEAKKNLSGNHFFCWRGWK